MRSWGQGRAVLGCGGLTRVQLMVRVARRVADDVMPVAGPARGVVWSGSELVLVNHPAEHVASADRWSLSPAVGCWGIRRIEVESARRSSAAVMIDVLGEDPVRAEYVTLAAELGRRATIPAAVPLRYDCC